MFQKLIVPLFVSIIATSVTAAAIESTTPAVTITSKDGVTIVRKFDRETESTLIHAIFNWKINNFPYFLHDNQVIRMDPVSSVDLGLGGADGQWTIQVQSRNLEKQVPITTTTPRYDQYGHNRYVVISASEPAIVTFKPVIGLALQRYNGTTGTVTAHMRSVRIMSDYTALYTTKDVFHHKYDADEKKEHGDEVFGKETFLSHDHFTGAADKPQYLGDDGSLSLKIDVYFFLWPENSAAAESSTDPSNFYN